MNLGDGDRRAAAATPGRVVDASKLDLAAAERAARDLLRAIGADLDTPELVQTPRRVAASFAELVTPAEFEATLFPNEGYDELVLVRDIPFQTLCMHHLLPFHGEAHVAYLPGDSDHRHLQARPRGRGVRPGSAAAGAHDRSRSPTGWSTSSRRAESGWCSAPSTCA